MRHKRLPVIDIDKSAAQNAYAVTLHELLLKGSRKDRHLRSARVQMFRLS
jgi:hypothetical protein